MSVPFIPEVRTEDIKELFKVKYLIKLEGEPSLQLDGNDRKETRSKCPRSQVLLRRWRLKMPWHRLQQSQIQGQIGPQPDGTPVARGLSHLPK